MSNLKYFTSVNTNSPQQFAESLQDILQQEHNFDGSHPKANSSQSGFMTPDQVQMLEEVWRWIQDQKSKS